MSYLKYYLHMLLVGLVPILVTSISANQTPDVSPIFPETFLPFRVRIELLKDKEGNDFLLPNGLQAYNVAVHKGKWLLLNGRTNGLHSFNDDPNNFPPQAQNTILYVVDPIKKTIALRSLLSSNSGLDTDQIDSLSVTDAQSYQVGHTLYMTGGYGFRKAINNFTTFDALSAINVPGLIRWVEHSHCTPKAAPFIRQIFNPVFKITGGDMYQLSKKSPTLLVFGQDFEGAYLFANSAQDYSCQVRRFHIYDDGKNLEVKILDPKPLGPNPNYRRRDLNTVPVIAKGSRQTLIPGLVALSGVFTLDTGIWTVPVSIRANGDASMADPNLPSTFKQGMNNYNSPTLGLFSRKTGDMYTVLFGGISYGFFENGTFQTDAEIPFINQVTTIKIDSNGDYSQYLMDAQYPVILSTQSNPGNPLLFGANAQFIPASRLKKYQYRNGVFKLDQIKKSILIGYIVGGIQSTLPNTNTSSDSAASPYIFQVFLDPTD